MKKEIKSAVLDYVRDQPWAIGEQYLDLIHTVLYHRLVEGKGFDLERAKELARNMGKEYGGPLELVGTRRAGKTDSKSIMVIPVVGTMAKRMSLFHDISGGVSAEGIMKEMTTGLSNDEVDAIVLHVDTPGGTVDGTERLANFIYQNRGVKPILTHADGLMASAGVWAFTAAEKVHAESSTTSVGSIGVITAHYDYSKYDEMKGVKRTFLYAGKYKALGNDAEPLSRSDEDIIQARLDTLYTIFINAVARNLGEEAELVRDGMADARIFLADEAKTRGLIHEVMSLEETIEVAADMSRKTVSENFYEVAYLKDGVIIGQDKISMKGGLPGKPAAHHEFLTTAALLGLAPQQDLAPKSSQADVKQKKEEVTMDVKILESRITELEGKNKELASHVSDLTGQLTTAAAKAGELEKANEILKNEKGELDKELTILKANNLAKEEKAQADAILSKALEGCNVDEKFHIKIVEKFEDLSKYRTKEKAFDSVAYEAAVVAEVKDWEEKLGIPTGAGLGHTQGKGHVESKIVTSEDVKSVLANVLPKKKTA